MEGCKARTSAVSVHLLVVERASIYSNTSIRFAFLMLRLLNLMGLFVNEVSRATCGSSSSRMPRTVASPFGKLGVYHTARRTLMACGRI